MKKITIELIKKITEKYDLDYENHDLGERARDLVGKTYNDEYDLLKLLGYRLDEHGDWTCF
jgi:hypothetical protein